MRNKELKRRLIAIATVSTFSLSLLWGIPEFNLRDSILQVKAVGYTTGDGTRSTKYGVSPKNGYMIYDVQSQCTGVRIYLAENKAWKKHDVGLSADKLSMLDTYKQFALYELSGDYGYTIYSGKSTGWWHGLGEVEQEDGTYAIEGVEYNIKPCQLLDNPYRKEVDGKYIIDASAYGINDSNSADFNHYWTFDELLGEYAKDAAYPERVVYDGSSNLLNQLSDWANTQFEDKMSEEKLQTLLDNYHAILQADRDKYQSEDYITGYDDYDKLPKTVTDYIDGGWSFIVEPLMITRLVSNKNDSNEWITSSKYVFSYNDFTRGQDCEGDLTGKTITGVSDTGANSLWRLTGGITSNVNDGIPKMVNQTLRTFYTDFEYKEVVVNGNKDYLAGFGMYAMDDNIITYGDFSSNTNLTLYGDATDPNAAITANGKTVLTKAQRSDNYSNYTMYNAEDSGRGSWYGNIDWEENYSDITSVDDIQYYDWGTTAPETLPKLPDKAATKETAKSRLTATAPSSDYKLMQYTASTITMDTTGTDLSNLYKYLDEPTLQTYSLGVEECVRPNSGTQIGSNYTVSLKKTADTNKSVNTTMDEVIEDITRGICNDTGEVQIDRLIDYTPTDSLTETEAENAVINSVTYALTKSEFKYNRTTNEYSNPRGKTATTGVTTQLYVKDEKVSSQIVKITRDAEGKFTYSDITDTGEYSAYDGFGVLEKEDSTGDRATDKTTYIVAIPNTTENKNGGYTLADSGETAVKNMKEAIFTFADNMVKDYSGAAGYINLRTRVNQIMNAVDIENAMSVSVGVQSQTTNIAAHYTEGNFTGYSIYIIEDNYISTADQTGYMQLKPNELNYVYPTLLGENPGILYRLVGGVNDVTISKTNNYKGFLTEMEVLDGGRTTNLLNLGFRLSSALEGTFAPEYQNDKIFSSSTNVILNHAVNLNRADFGDKYTVSALSPIDDASTASFITDVLGLDIASTLPSTSTLVSGSAGVLQTIATGDTTFEWKSDKAYPVIKYRNVVKNVLNPDGTIAYEEDGVTPKTETVRESYIAGYNAIFNPNTSNNKLSHQYNVSTDIYHYTPKDSSSRPAGSTENKLFGVYAPSDNTFDYRASSVESFETELNFTPETPMIVYKYTTGNNCDGTDRDITAAPQPVTVNVLSQYQRKVKANGLYNIGVSGGLITGKFTSDTIATSTDAKKLSQSYGDIPVVYAGGNMTLTTSCDASINVSGFMLDSIDKNTDGVSGAVLIGDEGTSVAYNKVIANNEDLKAVWKNDTYSAKDKYTEWVSAFKNNLGFDISLKSSNGDEYTGFTPSVSSIDGGDIISTKAYALTFSGGDVVNDGAYAQLKMQIAKERFGVSADADVTTAMLTEADSVFKSSGIIKAILDSIEDVTDSDNGSSIDGSAKYYDECVRTFVIRYFECEPITFGNMITQDKLGYDMGSNTGIKFESYLTVYLKEATNSFSNVTVYNRSSGSASNYTASKTSGGIIIPKAYINNADFVIAGNTTNMK